MMLLDYTTQGRRPSSGQIVADWKKGGRPERFEVVYGETYAEFEFILAWGARKRWNAHGNGCEGIKRDAVLAALDKAAGVAV